MFIKGPHENDLCIRLNCQLQRHERCSSNRGLGKKHSSEYVPVVAQAWGGSTQWTGHNSILSGQVWGMRKLFADISEELSLLHIEMCLTRETVGLWHILTCRGSHSICHSMHSCVTSQTTRLGETFQTHCTWKWVFTRMSTPCVSTQVPRLWEPLQANCTRVRLLTSVHPCMPCQVTWLWEALTTYSTWKRFLPCMNPCVSGQVSCLGETLPTHITTEWSVCRMHMTVTN